MKYHTYSQELIQIEEKDFLFLKALFIQWKIEKQRKSKLDKDSLEILKYFINHQDDASPYQCHKYLKKEKLSNMAPNNVRKNVKKLCEFGLLKEKKFCDYDGNEQEINKRKSVV